MNPAGRHGSNGQIGAGRNHTQGRRHLPSPAPLDGA